MEVSLAPLTVAGDRDRLRQVIDNLLSNVRSHTPPDAPLAVKLARENGYAVLSVDDSGPGMDADQVSHAFERFYRADPSRARASGGAGLGLAIVAAVVQAHGGKVEAESAPGEGTTFRVRLPLVSRFLDLPHVALMACCQSGSHDKDEAGSRTERGRARPPRRERRRGDEERHQRDGEEDGDAQGHRARPPRRTAGAPFR